MKKIIFIYDYMQNGNALFEYIRNNDEFGLLKKNKVIYIPFRINKKIKDKFKRLLEIGVINIIKSFVMKNTIIVSTSPSKFQSMISQNIICMNHGWATKKTPGNDELKNTKILEECRRYKKSCKYIICLSDFDSTYYLKAKELNDIKSPIFLPFGIPRNDYLIENQKKIEIKLELESKLKLEKKCEKVFLFAPTHRENEINNKIFLDKILDEFNGLDEELVKRNEMLLFRPHYFSQGLKDKINKFNNIVYCGYDEIEDIRDLMIFSDVLVTDYSSAFIDYLLLDKPIIFYNWDIEEYSNYKINKIKE